MKCVINNQVVLSRVPEGPLAAHIDAFAAFVAGQGYAPYSMHLQVRLVSDFSRWLQQQGVELERITSDYPEQYLRYRARKLQPCRSDAATLRYLTDFLRSEGVIPTEKESTPLTSVERCLQAYKRYLCEVRGLSQAATLNYVPVVRGFLTSRFGNGPVRLSRLRAHDVVQFVQRQAPHLSMKRAKLMTSALRSFLRYARYSGQVTLDLAAAVPVVPSWSMTSIPRAISPDQVRQLLASIDRHTAKGRRDYAILLLLARMGLRASEVVFLELDDIDWKAGAVIVRAKGGLHNAFPLPDEVGKAIAAYLKDGRPPSTCRRVFLRARAPVCGFRGAGAISSLVRHALLRAGIQAPTYGAHQFRHGLATDLLRHGASLGEIGDVLGHRHPQTTQIYTRVDLEALRTLALPWPGGAR